MGYAVRGGNLDRLHLITLFHNYRDPFVDLLEAPYARRAMSEVKSV